MTRSFCFALALILPMVLPGAGFGQTDTPPTSPPTDTPAPPEISDPPSAAIEPLMTVERLAGIIGALDPDAVARGPALEFTLADIPVIVIVDGQADRMRAMVPIASAEGLTEADLIRMMQANFDTALDARYAIAHGRLWGVFIHPLSPLKKDQFLSGLVQTITVAQTYGNGYTGGGAVFGGGDSNQIYRELLDELRKKGAPL